MKYELYEGTILICKKFKVEKETPGIQMNASHFHSVTTKSEVYKENVALVKIRPFAYVEEERFKNLLSRYRLVRHFLEKGFFIDDLLMPTFPYGVNTLYVDSKTLVKKKAS